MSKQSRARAAAKAATSAKATAAGRTAVPSEPNPFLARWGTVLAGSIVVLAAIAAYYNSFSGPFILDDPWAITNNPTIRHFWSALSPPPESMIGGRLLVSLTYAFNYALGGINVGGYHAFNLFIHVLAGLTLFGIVRRTLHRPALDKRFGTSAMKLALMISVLWVVHPLQTEAVTYVCERAESLMALFYLLTLYAFIRSVESGTPPRWQVLSVAACFLGVLSKETIVTVPVMVLLYDRTFVAGSFWEAWQQRWRYYLGLASTWLLLAFLMTNYHPRGVGFDQQVGWWDYALTSCRTVVLYLKLAIWPHPLVLDYGNDIVHHATDVLPYALILVAFLIGTAIALYRWPVVGFAAAWLFLILAPTTSIVPVAGQPMAEHRMYLSLVAVIGLVVLGLYAWIGRRSLIVFAATALGLGWLTIQRNEVYRSALAIYRDTVAKCPGNERAHYNLGRALTDSSRAQEAITEYEAALQIKPDDVMALNNLGMTLATIPGRAPEAISRYEAALQIKPDLEEAHCNLAKILATIPNRVPEAISHYETALRIKPDDAEAHNNLGKALARTPGRLPDAISHYEAALRINPDLAETHYNLAGVLTKTPDRWPDAISHYEAALRINPDFTAARNNLAAVHNNLGMLLRRKGDVSAAIAEYKAALQVKPAMAEAHINLGAALSTIPGRLPDAILEYDAALQLKPGDPTALRNLELAQNMLLKNSGKDGSEPHAP
jgi:tetratricopeptide (TPR) repeat protein